MPINNYKSKDLHYDSINWRPGSEKRVYLDHSCDEWSIGKREDVVRMIADLNKLLLAYKLDGVN